MSDNSGERGTIPGHRISDAIQSRRINRGYLGRLWDRLPTPIKGATVLTGFLGLFGLAGAIDAPPQQPIVTPTSPTQTAEADLAKRAADLRAQATFMAQQTPESTAIKPPTPTVAPTATAKLPGTLPPFK